MGEVWQARHDRLKHRVAIKFFTSRLEDRTRFELEGQVGAQLAARCKAIVPVFDRGELEDGTAYLVMEYVNGPSLQAVLERSGPPPWRVMQAIASQAAAALREAHRAGIVHRDLKPPNLLLAGYSSDGDVSLRLTDFGIAKAIATDLDVDQPHPTGEGTFVGSPAYLPPEALLGRKPAGPDTDLWALACTLYEALTGRPPFAASSLPELVQRVANERHEPPSHVAFNLSPDVDAFFDRALAKDPARRFPDVDAFADAFASLSPPRALSWSERVGRRRHLLAVLALVGLGLSAIMVSQRAASEEQSKWLYPLSPSLAAPLFEEPVERLADQPTADDPNLDASEEVGAAAASTIPDQPAASPPAARPPTANPTGASPAPPPFDPSEIQ